MKRIIPLIAFALIMLGTVHADELMPGHLFYGIVTINGAPADDGVLVSVRTTGSDVAAAVTADGKYGYNSLLRVPSDYEGKVLKFYLNGVNTGITAGFTANTSKTKLDIAVSGELFCGDNICSAGESCSSCSADCGTCPVTTTSGSSGGSSGGGGGGYIPPRNTTSTSGGNSLSAVEETCVPDWTCSDWLPCIGGEQKRVCVDANKCAEPSTLPEVSKACDTTQVAGSNEPGVLEAKTAEDQIPSKSKNLFTGAVAGGGTMLWIGLGIIIVVIGALFAGYFFAKRKSARKK
jgi:hypothetical protein